MHFVQFPMYLNSQKIRHEDLFLFKNEPFNFFHLAIDRVFCHFFKNPLYFYLGYNFIRSSFDLYKLRRHIPIEQRITLYQSVNFLNSQKIRHEDLFLFKNEPLNFCCLLWYYFLTKNLTF